MKKIFLDAEPRRPLPEKKADNPQMMFILGGLRAARATHGKARAVAIRDLCEVMQCSEKELQFLFQGEETTSSIFAMPDDVRREAALQAVTTSHAAE